MRTTWKLLECEAQPAQYTEQRELLRLKSKSIRVNSRVVTVT